LQNLEQTKLHAEISTGQSKIKQSLIQKARAMSESRQMIESRLTEAALK